MNDLISLDFESIPIRAVLLRGEPWWAATDLAALLGYRDAPNMTRMLEDDEKGTHIVDTPGGPQSLTIISESGLFAAILKSRKPEARRFRRWVTGEVLPALRRHGRYTLLGSSPEPMDGVTLTAAVNAVREARRLFGPQSARAIWLRLGLPSPLADCGTGPEAIAADPLAAAIGEYLATVGETTIEEAATALGIAPLDPAGRVRLGQLLRLYGWYPRKQRRGRKVVNLFTPRTVKEAVHG